MRFVISVAIVTFWMAIESKAAPNGPEIEMTVFRVISGSSSDADDDAQADGMEEVALLNSDQEERQEDLDLILRRFMEFSAKFSPAFQGKSDCVFSPLIQYLFLLTFPYRTEDTKTRVMKGLGFTYQERRIVKRAVQRFIASLNPDYVEFENDDESSILRALTNMHEWFQRDRPMSPPRRPSNDHLPKSIRGRGGWQLIFPNARSEMRDFYVNGNERVRVPTMCSTARRRYGKLENLDSTVMEMFPQRDEKYKEMSIFVIRSDSQRGFQLLMKQLGKTNFTKFREFREKNVNFCVPKISIETEIKVQEWAPQVFEHNNPFESNIDYYDFSTIFSIEWEARTTVSHFVNDLSTKIRNNLRIKNTSTPTASSAETGAAHSSQSGQTVTFNVDRPYIIIEVEKGEPDIELYTIIVTGSTFRKRNA